MVTSVTTLSVIWLGLVDQDWVIGILSGECCFFCKVLNFIMTWDWIISSAFADHQHVLLVWHVLMIFLIYLISNIVLFKIWCCLFSVIWSTWAWMALMVIHVSVPVLDTWLLVGASSTKPCTWRSLYRMAPPWDSFTLKLPAHLAAPCPGTHWLQLMLLHARTC